MPKKYDVVAITGKYEKDGQTKNRYMNIGAIIEAQGSLMLKLEAVPISWDGFAYLNDPQKFEGRRDSAPAPREAPQRFTKPGSAASYGSAGIPSPPAKTGTGFDDMDDDIPF